MTTKDEVARRVRKELGLNEVGLSELTYTARIWDALISSEMRVEELSEEQVSSEQYKCAMEVFNEEIAEWKPRAEKAEARVEELHEALRKIDEMLTGKLPITLAVKSIARAALSVKEKV